MKITPNNALFTAISQFPDAAQVRAKQAARPQPPDVNRQGSPRPADDPRGQLIRDALRQAAQNQMASAKTVAQAPAEPALQSYSAGSVRREAPLPEARPAFVRLGQFIDLKV